MKKKITNVYFTKALMGNKVYFRVFYSLGAGNQGSSFGKRLYTDSEYNFTELALNQAAEMALTEVLTNIAAAEDDQTAEVAFHFNTEYKVEGGFTLECRPNRHNTFTRRRLNMRLPLTHEEILWLYGIIARTAHMLS